MKLYENYLLKESKWKDLLKLGKLSFDDLKKIQKYKGLADKLHVKQLLKNGKTKEAMDYLVKMKIIKPLVK
jgi:hypothetical protein